MKSSMKMYNFLVKQPSNEVVALAILEEELLLETEKVELESLSELLPKLTSDYSR